MSVKRTVRMPGSGSAAPPGIRTAPVGWNISAAKECFCNLGLYLNHFSATRPSALPVDLVRCLGRRSLNETEQFSASLVHPVFEILNIVLSLRHVIRHVGLPRRLLASPPQGYECPRIKA